MTPLSACVIGSELPFEIAPPGLTGIPRVVVRTHAALLKELSHPLIELVPVSTRSRIPAQGRSHSESITNDPLNDLAFRSLEDIDLLLMLGLNMRTDFVRIFNERRRRRLPVISLIYDTIVLKHPEWFLDHGRTHFRAYLQQLLRVSDHVVVPSTTVQDDLLGLGWNIAGQVHVLPLGTSFRQQVPMTLPSDPLRLLYVSTVAPYKGHALLLDAFDAIKDRGTSVELQIVGRQGWNADQIARRIRGHKDFGTLITWEQTADDHVVMERARTSHIAVIPTQSEGFGLFQEEALSLGMKVVAQDIPVLRERPYPNVMYSAGNARDMASAILTAHARPYIPLADQPVRTMTDFASDLRSLILDELLQGGSAIRG